MSLAGADREHPLTVAGLLEAAGAALDASVGDVWVRAEVFENRNWPVAAASGHHYFTLSDGPAKLDAKMWRGVAARSLRCELARGSALLVRGRLDIYAPNGRMSLIVDWAEGAGAGDLARRFEELKRRLQAEGLFAAERKRALPARPRRVVVICGRGSAAEADVLRTFVLLAAPFHVLLRPARVQGGGAAEDLVAALVEAAAVRPDAILIARGGGSLEDLWAFNEEAVARAVAACPVPVISAVGHETDTTLCDLAADERALTPTAGAALLCDGWRAAREDLTAQGRALERAAAANLHTARLRVERGLHRLRGQEPRRRLDRARHTLAELERRALAAAATHARSRRTTVERLARRCAAARPAARLAVLAARLHELGPRLAAADPRAPLARGYALVSRADAPRADFLRRAQDAPCGTALRIQLAEGEVRARVE
jgi:exodeoxyribonuclease VII large subunit